MFCIKVNRAHPTGVINLRDEQNRPLRITSRAWTQVATISPSMEIWRKYLIIENAPKCPTEVKNTSPDSTVPKYERVPVEEIRKPGRPKKV